MLAVCIPTGNAEIVNDYSQSEAILDRCSFSGSQGDGDAAGKGWSLGIVKRQHRRLQLHGGPRRRPRRRPVLLEQYLEWAELVLLFTDGQSVALMSRRDYKRVGRRSGIQGMGLRPTRLCHPELMEWIRRTIIEPTVEAMAAEGGLTAECCMLA